MIVDGWVHEATSRYDEPSIEIKVIPLFCTAHLMCDFELISHPDLTLSLERWDLVKLDSTPFFIGY